MCGLQTYFVMENRYFVKVKCFIGMHKLTLSWSRLLCALGGFKPINKTDNIGLAKIMIAPTQGILTVPCVACTYCLGFVGTVGAFTYI